MNRSAKALRVARPLAVVAVWAGLLGYVIPAAFVTTPPVSATAAAATSHAHSSSPSPKSRVDAGGADRALVRVIQAAPRPHRVTVTLGGQALSHDQEFASVTPYRPVRPGTWTIRAEGAAEHAATRVTLAAGSTNTLIVVDGPGHLIVSARQDSAGRPAAPKAIAAGPGGPAPKAGGSTVPWLVLGGTALLLALAGLARLRQFWWARRVAAHVR
jgi:LPXTG-motif cell wall-anchored protein